MKNRKSSIERKTLETSITVEIDLDGSGVSLFDTGLPFLEHMLDQIARHGMIDLSIKAEGDLSGPREKSPEVIEKIVEVEKEVIKYKKDPILDNPVIKEAIKHAKRAGELE